MYRLSSPIGHEILLQEVSMGLEQLLEDNVADCS